ncbi:MAG: DNA polymerase/3'-5' exonuclease PolX [Candidatus Thorarchaeota archaeon]|nr:MAG: DNA polymerase/3'-5' exonuclease PolX [Candidatus Thorarchaeota archaeon]
MTKNAEVAKVLKEIGLLLQVEGKDKFKFLAYLRGVRSIASLGEDITSVAERGELTKIQGIGKGLAEVITSYLETGEVELLTELRTRVPIKVLELDAIPGVGPKTIKLVYEKLGITDLEGLERAALEGKLSGLPSLGTKTEGQILSGIGLVKTGLDRTILAEALSIAKGIEDELRKIPGIHQLVIAGSARRRRETIGDIDILVDASDSKLVMDTFVGYSDVSSITAHGDTKSSVRLTGGLQIDLRLLPAESFGAGLQYFTGSVDHNVRLRAIAKKKNLTLNEYGLFRDEEKIAGKDEVGIYKALGLDLIEPELREDKGEIEAALNGDLPTLIEVKDIRGDLHSHTNQSDGRNSIEEMLNAAETKGYAYYCVSDHTQSLTIANGLDEKRLLNRIVEIDELNASGRWKMKILKGAEVDILGKGALDIEDSVLSELDVVTVSVHSRMKEDRKTMTERVCHAIENKHVHILGHPTGRLVLKRPEFEIDLDAVFETAAKNNVVMELNAHPKRLDLNAGNLRAAKRAGLKIAINTDAHIISELDNMQFGIYEARRGWVTKKDVINTYSLKKMLSLLKK